MAGLATVTDDNSLKATSQMHIKLYWSHNKPCPDNVTLH